MEQTSTFFYSSLFYDKMIFNYKGVSYCIDVMYITHNKILEMSEFEFYLN